MGMWKWFDAMRNVTSSYLPCGMRSSVSVVRCASSYAMMLTIQQICLDLRLEEFAC
jgi:hypothetical protein